ncbi:hypothetical protein [Negadavirga shengliensis]|uniref:DUF4843 domain-containing protein n=1 Tax=Negadavirga shengliensis TaxID=1389218 RepID=A0ABV9SW89_9BACT
MKKPLSHLSLTVFVALLHLFSCGETELKPTEEYYIKFKVNGEQKEYNTDALNPVTFTFDQNGPVYQAILQVLGPGSDGKKNFINIITRNETVFEVNKSYRMHEAISYQNASLARIIFTWADENGDLYNAVLLKGAFPTLEIKDEGQLMFSGISQDMVTGSFTANIIGPVSPTTGRGNTELSITEGEFKLKLINTVP